MVHMEKIIVKVLGPEVACNNCRALQKNVEEAIKEVSSPRFEFEVRHENAASKENIEKFGLLKLPATVAREFILFQGSVPSKEEIVKKLRTLLKQL